MNKNSAKLDLLSQPFPLDAISWKINNYSANKMKGMITFHVDARAVQERLNDVFGVLGWSFNWTKIDGNCVQGRLEILSVDPHATKEDVGYAGEDEKEPLKGAVSDALKRCAVHLGLGHYLYSLPMLWIDLESEQKFLSKAQDEKILNWYKGVINGDFSNNKAIVPPKVPQAPKVPELPIAPVSVIDALLDLIADHADNDKIKAVYDGKYYLSDEQKSLLRAARKTADNTNLVEDALLKDIRS